MGVPALFRWLSQKYPKIISSVIEDYPRVIDGEEIPVDATTPNPNGEEFDNLYLDMNGIVHNCSHPEDRPAPSTEADMMLEIFKYTDRVVNMARPRKLLMIAVDGVAPRAKQNQQRSRRFRSAKEAQEKDEDKAELIKLLKVQNGGILPEGVLDEMNKKTWDSNAITPGTPFMDILAQSLRYWVAYKLNTDTAWEKLKILISDATVPGEGEHKIMNFIRSQRISPEHNPNTRHIIYGLDADLIMLGLATHEPHFRVLREDVFAQDSKARTCRICGQTGHKADECRGEAKQKQGEFDEKTKISPLKPFIWLNISILREYLAIEMEVPNLNFKPDLERVLDDWVFMCFFVGNDFLPHLPSLDIRHEGIDTLIAIWRDNLPVMGGYVTKDGHVDLERAQHILAGLAKQEDAIFKRRRVEEERREANAKRRKQNDQNRPPPGRRSGDSLPLSAADFQLTSLDSIRDQTKAYRDRNLQTTQESSNGLTHDMIVNRGDVQKANEANKSAAAMLKERLKSRASADGESTNNVPHNTPRISTNATETPSSTIAKRKREPDEDDVEGDSALGRSSPVPAAEKIRTVNPDEPPPDNVRLWEEGYADRYYEQKFHVSPDDHAFRHKVGRAYVEGLAWVLLYYFQGCPSWTWYYPYHYAPFAADFVDLGDIQFNFEKGIPFRPYEQLMAVMPAASNHTIPEVFHELMTSEESDIIDFYPENFEIDLNGKKFAWQGVAILPFIDEKRLLKAMATKYPLLSVAEVERNTVGREVLLFSDRHPLYESIATQFYSKKKTADKVPLIPQVSEGLAGNVEKNDDFLPQSSLTFPLPEGGMPNLDEDHSMTVHYYMPQSKHIHKSMLLRGVQFAQPALDEREQADARNRARKTGRGFGGVPFSGSYNGGGRGRNGYGSAPINYAADQQPSRANPFAAHLNPGFFQNGMPPPPPLPNAAGWAPPPPGLPAFPGGMTMPPGGIPGLSGYPAPAWQQSSAPRPPTGGHASYGQGNGRGGNDARRGQYGGPGRY